MSVVTRIPSKESANVLLAQDDDLGSDVARTFYHRLQGHSRVTCAYLGFSTVSGICGCAVLPSRSEFPEWVEFADPVITWADLFVVVLGTDRLAKMLHGITDSSFLLKLLRSWDVSKKILLVPLMSKNAWEHPMTRKQLSKIRRKWNWIRVLEPILSSNGDKEEKSLDCWPGMDEMVKTVQNQAEILTMGHDLDTTHGNMERTIVFSQPSKTNLPSEIWSMILEHVRDWELAQTLGIYANLSVPQEWERLIPRNSDVSPDLHSLEWTILTRHYSQIVAKLETSGPPRWLSSMCVKLIIRFARTDLLSYLEVNHKQLFWSTFGHRLLPNKASVVFGRTEILEWWKTSPSFLTKEYTAETMDLASKAGFIHVLEWWHNSGLPLRFTEAALEQAASIEVLEWWRTASKASSSNKAPLRLKVGRSLLFAAQNGQAEMIRWWATSGISTGHEDAVARTASANGHVNVLQEWKACKGDKMQFDNQILIGPTRNAHVEVMEWWKQSGYGVEYKTCDIEEALEDSSGGDGEGRIRTWWAKNGLNLGVGTSEWMKVKIL